MLLAATVTCNLVYGAFFGQRVDSPPRVYAVQSSGNDDVERSLLHILHFGGVILLNCIVSRKGGMNRKGGQAACYGSATKRKKILVKERRALIRTVMKPGQSQRASQRSRGILQWWLKSKFLREAMGPRLRKEAKKILAAASPASSSSSPTSPP